MFGSYGHPQGWPSGQTRRPPAEADGRGAGSARGPQRVSRCSVCLFSRLQNFINSEAIRAVAPVLLGDVVAVLALRARQVIFGRMSQAFFAMMSSSGSVPMRPHERRHSAILQRPTRRHFALAAPVAAPGAVQVTGFRSGSGTRTRDTAGAERLLYRLSYPAIRWAEHLTPRGSGFPVQRAPDAELNRRPRPYQGRALPSELSGPADGSIYPCSLRTQIGSPGRWAATGGAIW